MFITMLAFAVLAAAYTTRAPGGDPDPQSFVGTWSGKWDGKQSAKLVVEKVDGNEATWAYSYEPIADWGVNEPGGANGVATIEGRTLRVGHATFMFVNDTRLDGKLEVGNFTNLGAFTKQ